MILRRYVSTVSVVCSLTFGFTGSALAADVTLGNTTTGPGSEVHVALENTNTQTVENTNVLQVMNASEQQSETGNVNAENNTSIDGPLQSGDAKNANDTTNVITLANGGINGVAVGGNGRADGITGFQKDTGSVGGGGQAGAGNVLGAATAGGLGGGQAVLPAVGASIPIDVSGLRDGWQPRAGEPVAELAKGSRLFTTMMLAVAMLLGLLGAAGSAWYGRRREERVMR